MPEPITTVGLGAIAAYLGKDGIQKLLGPTADYLGGGLKDFTQKRIDNVGKIFKRADEKLGDRRDQPGTIPPKILKTIINDASFNDDALAVEYFGGVLASSRTQLGRDDRGARMAKLVDSLSTYQLRAHFLIYASIRNLFKDCAYHFNVEDRAKMTIHLPYKGFLEAMAFADEETLKIEPLLRHIFFGLAQDGLIENRFLYGDAIYLQKRYPACIEHGICCQPSALGAELFLWARGDGDKALSFIFDDTCTTSYRDLPNGIADATAISAL